MFAEPLAAEQFELAEVMAWHAQPLPPAASPSASSTASSWRYVWAAACSLQPRPARQVYGVTAPALIVDDGGCVPVSLYSGGEYHPA